MKRSKPRVLLGMSGGVDSSVCAALLQQQGYDVIGITMQLLPKEQEASGSCCNRSAVCDAQRVAHSLGIPHYVINGRNAFETHVVNPFIDRYLSGQTPNPCIECNRAIKFDVIREVGIEFDTEWVATGHYVRKRRHPITKEYGLYKAMDTKKDQSYFLYPMTESGLCKTLFPLGRYTKPQIRDLAARFNLITATKPDSQEICFVTKGHYADFVEKHRPDAIHKGGLIVDLDGKVWGTHQGIHHFTVGQRKGLQIAAGTPMYVHAIDPHTHQVLIGPGLGVHSTHIHLGQPTLISPTEQVRGRSFLIKLRSQMTPVWAKVMDWSSSGATLELGVPVSFVSPGQSAVLYDGNRVVGGGILQPATW